MFTLTDSESSHGAVHSVRVRRYSRSVFMSWLLPCCRSAPPLAMGWRFGEVWLSGRGASCSASLLLLSSPLPEALAESEELLLPLLLICSITSTSARSSVNGSRVNNKTQSNTYESNICCAPCVRIKFGHGWTSLPLLMSSS